MVTTTSYTALTALAEVPANNDVLALDDTSAVATKGILAAFLRRAKVDSVTVTGSITFNAIQLVTLNSASAIALTVSGSPTAGDILAIFRKGSGAVNHTVVLGSSIDYDASGNGTATLADDGDCLIAIAESATRWIVLYNNGVSFSA